MTSAAQRLDLYHFSRDAGGAYFKSNDPRPDIDITLNMGMGEWESRDRPTSIRLEWEVSS